MIIPALDLINGQVVRLSQGDYNKQQQYLTSPIEAIKNYAQQGAKWLHIVDLDGAKNPEQRQLSLIKEMTHAISAPVQTGGGIRSEQDIQALLNSGVSRVVIGSVAITHPQLISQWFTQFGTERIVLALDIHIDEHHQKWVAIHGWQKSSNQTLEHVIDTFTPVGLQHILCTDISRDGMLNGPNVALYRSIAQQYPQLKIQASGGISNLHDIQQLKVSGASGVIVGKALLEKRFNVKEAIACWPNE